MKKYISAALFLLLAFLVGRASNAPRVEAQAPAPTAWTVIPGGPISTCSRPVGVTYVCFGTDDVIASKNGAAPVSLFPGAVAAGITGIIVNGGTPLTGPTVALTIPTKIVLNPVTPTGVIQ
jgi:hypothetical protein